MKKKLVAALVIGAVACSLLATLVVAARVGKGLGAGRGRGSVAVVHLSGTIVSGRASPFLSGLVGAEEVAQRLRQAARDPEVRAVVLRLNSPGGTAAGAQEIAREVDRLRQAGKKVVASMGDAAASGAYWIASRADKVVANPGTLTGSIGVIIQVQDLQGLYSKLGIATRTFKSGPHKDMGSPSRPVTPEEESIFQGMVEDIYAQFVQAVAEGRRMDPAHVRKLADGRVFTGRQAKELGLVDELGDLREAIRLAGELSGLGPDPPVSELAPRRLIPEIFLDALFPGKPSGLYPAPGTAIWLVAPPCLPPAQQFYEPSR
ncbi:signal peptide peptidase SppA [Desulfovirgula thermocuniculi]|uniref:signal peptide peptidase SppA n=1 Tax=Desulfovirgula thermocuniculi TaxID=348842 RepID=UPI0004238A6E|nr:signal peptide peptidase SppA [Desulfovirgula thermocuniculi]